MKKLLFILTTAFSLSGVVVTANAFDVNAAQFGTMTTLSKNVPLSVMPVPALHGTVIGSPPFRAKCLSVAVRGIEVLQKAWATAAAREAASVKVESAFTRVGEGFR